MPDTKTPKPVLCLEASSGTVTGLLDPSRQPAITIAATINGGGRQEYPLSRRQAINTYLVLGRLIRALRDDGQLPEKYLSLLDRGAVPFRRFAVRPASNKTEGHANA